jgi:hypothetical protein
MEDLQMDWKLKLMQILDCIGEMEGIWYDDCWLEYGITEKERQTIADAFIEYAQTKRGDG